MKHGHGALALALVLSSSVANAGGALALSGGGHLAPATAAVSLAIDEQVTTATFELTFASGGSAPSRFSMKLPDGASVVGFEVYRYGGWDKADMTTKDATKPSDPGPGSGSAGALSTYLGDDGFTIDLPALDTPEVKVRVVTLGLAAYDLGQITQLVPVEPAPLGTGGPTHTVIDVRVVSPRPFVGASGDLPEVSRATSVEGASHVFSARYEGTAKAPFRFTYSAEEDPGIYVRLVAHHTRCEQEGFFLLVVRPSTNVGEGDVQPKAFQFVMDTSGSMTGSKIAQAKGAAGIGVDLLGQGDTFNLIAFSSNVRTAFPAPRLVSDDARAAGHAFIDQQVADGATNISGSLMTAMSAAMDSDRARIVVFLTDGQATAGTVDASKIVQEVKAQNTQGARLYTFGIGDDVNKDLLKNLAVSNGGVSKMLSSSADLTKEIGDFLLSVSRPVLVDATTTWGSLNAIDTYPEGPQDLFAGRQLLLVGRYLHGGHAEAEMRGTLGGKVETSAFSVDFPACALGAAPFLPKLWAKTKVDALLARLAEKGTSDPAIVAEIEQLSREYGIESPYASYGVPASDPGSTGASAPASPGRGGLEDGAGCAVAEGHASAATPFALLGAAAIVGVARRRRTRR